MEHVGLHVPLVKWVAPRQGQVGTGSPVGNPAQLIY